MLVVSLTELREMQLDNATFRHLTKWCERNLRAPDAGREHMVAVLAEMDAEDGEYHMTQGWYHVASLCSVNVFALEESAA